LTAQEFGEVNHFPNAGHFDEFVEESPIGRVLPNFETQENDVLVKCVSSFRELRRVASDSSSSQVIRLLNELKQLRLWEGLHSITVLLEPVTL